jgi:hypothetical protein
MLRGTIRLGRIFGIEIGLHFSWFIIAALLTRSLAAHLYSVNSEWGQALVSTAAGVAALAFFAAILLLNGHTRRSHVPEVCRCHRSRCLRSAAWHG